MMESRALLGVFRRSTDGGNAKLRELILNGLFDFDASGVVINTGAGNDGTPFDESPITVDNAEIFTDRNRLNRDSCNVPDVSSIFTTLDNGISSFVRVERPTKTRLPRRTTSPPSRVPGASMWTTAR